MIRSSRTSTTIESLKGLYRRTFLLNFGVVEPRRVYRSSRPGHNLSRLLKTYRLASILDLQSGFGASPWYIAELRTTGGIKIDYFRLPIPFGRRPLRREAISSQHPGRLQIVVEPCVSVGGHRKRQRRHRGGGAVTW